MKYFYTIVFLLGVVLSSFSQGTIVNIAVYPVNPTPDDSIQLIVNSSFTSGDCPLDYKSHSITEHTIMAISHHCLGMAAYICDAIDTFEIGKLAAGTYKFDLTLTSGGLPIPCTPGIVIDDQDSLNFTVSQAQAIDEFSRLGLKFENPINEKIRFNKPLPAKVYIYSSSGQRVKMIEKGETESDLSELKSGLYIMRLKGAKRKLVKI